MAICSCGAAHRDELSHDLIETAAKDFAECRDKFLASGLISATVTVALPLNGIGRQPHGTASPTTKHNTEVARQERYVQHQFLNTVHNCQGYLYGMVESTVGLCRASY